MNILYIVSKALMHGPYAHMEFLSPSVTGFSDPPRPPIEDHQDIGLATATLG